MTDTSAPPSSATPAAGAEALIIEVAKTLQQIGRADLAERASVAAARLRRPATVVCVVGEFKQGKSSLINALLGQPVCPVDDDLATSAITLVRWGEQPAAVVRRKAESGAAGDPPTTETIPIEQVGDWVSEIGNPGNHKRVERVDIVVPSALLKQGLVIVDTPGMGGLGAGHAAATLSFLAVRRRVDLRQRRLGRAECAGSRVLATRQRSVPDRVVRADQDRPLPELAANHGPQSRSLPEGRFLAADGRCQQCPAE